MHCFHKNFWWPYITPCIWYLQLVQVSFHTICICKREPRKTKCGQLIAKQDSLDMTTNKQRINLGGGNHSRQNAKPLFSWTVFSDYGQLVSNELRYENFNWIASKPYLVVMGMQLLNCGESIIGRRVNQYTCQ